MLIHPPNTNTPPKAKGGALYQNKGYLPSDPASPSPGGAGSVCVPRARSRTGRRATAREKQSGGLFFSPRVLPPSPPRRRKRHIACGDFFAKVTSRSFCCAPFPHKISLRDFLRGPSVYLPHPRRALRLRCAFFFVHAPKSYFTEKNPPTVSR